MNSVIVPKIFKRDPSGFFNILFVAKSVTKPEWRPFGNNKKNSRKVSHCRRKIENPSVSPGLANARKRAWLKQELQHVTAGFPLNRIHTGGALWSHEKKKKAKVATCQKAPTNNSSCCIPKKLGKTVFSI